MRLLERENFTALFREDLPIYTKIKDQVPTRYTSTANVTNSLVGDGCTMAGTVENCIIFRGVTIEPGAVGASEVIGTEGHGHGARAANVPSNAQKLRTFALVSTLLSSAVTGLGAYLGHGPSSFMYICAIGTLLDAMIVFSAHAVKRALDRA